ncbi:MAG: AI-2E family transporter [Defluviicoccus sp.]
MRIQSVAVSGLFVLAALYTIYFAKAILMPLVAAMILYFVLWPVVRLLTRLRIPPPLGALIVVAGLLGAGGTGIYFLADPASAWMSQAPKVLSQIQAKIKTPIKELTEAKEQVEGLIETGKRGSAEAAQKGGGPSVGIADAAVIVLGTVQQVGVTLLMITVLLYLLLASGTMFQEKLVRSLPRFRHKKQAVAITNQIQKDITGYLGTVTLINAGLGLAIGLGLFAIGLPNAALWGTMAALLNFIPYIGFAVGTAIVFIVGLVTFPALSDALLPPAIYIACQVVESNVITPIVLSRRLTLNAVVVFLAVVAWGWLWGISGALMAVPLLAVLKVIADRVDGLAGLSEFLGGREPAPD